MTTTPAIVIVAYNRSHTLLRLLSSVASAVYTENNIQLIISIDHSGNESILNLCESFNWKYGDKKIIVHNENLGLKNHIMHCCALSNIYGAVIILEDDLIVSPHYYTYATQALMQYKDDTSLAGISLYSYAVAESCLAPFYPLADGYSNYFLQLPSSWGQVFTAQQWQSFALWYDNNKTSNNDILPEYIAVWGSKSWKKHFVQYMIEQEKYFVFPKIAYSTNCGDPGVNTDRQGLYQVQLANSPPQSHFSILEQSTAVYDTYFEMLPDRLSRIAPTLTAHNYTVDLYGTKDLGKISRPFLLSSKPCHKPILTYGNIMPEAIQNICTGIEGTFYSLGNTIDFTEADIDPLRFYINVNPVKDIILDKYITTKLESYIQNMEYRQKYPPVIFVFLNTTGNTQNYVKTLNYPADRIKAITLSNGEALPATGNSHDNAYYILLQAGDPVNANIAIEAVAVMQKYPDINWLTFASATSATAQRWNKRLHKLSMLQNSPRRINPSFTVIKQTAWNFITGIAVSNISEVWDKLFDTQQLYTCVSNKVEVNNTSKQLLEPSLTNKLWEQLTLANVKYLRSYYKNQQGLTPVVRQTQDGTYFLSEY